ncbi:uncharacterized protein N0V89_006585 [Didymosphaeria variabile]|uniref:BTB domain-containing protein n=1 Tax=Didymosphaeria variabile TaxID=1932322 RepID=A0A9W8XJA4_9PLEO|nr:uncharacterized protein N0V89_006585 [Didymosphaeria variabile]KAJ4351246.1 hypothetical protein N0V89_006585 [Didymosphaeria variabile]
MATKPGSAGTSLFNNPTLSDVKIKQIYEGKVREYHAHKQILARGSKFFLNAFTGNFKEASGNVIEVHNDVPEHFEAALKFLYTQQYDSEAVAEQAFIQNAQRIRVPIGILVVADKYDIERLSGLIVDDVKIYLLTTTRLPVLVAAIKEYYPNCPNAGSPMGIALTTVLLGRPASTHTEEVKLLIGQYLAFGADMAIHLHECGRLRV